MVQIILTFNTLWCDIVAVTWCRPMYEPLFPRWWPKRPLLEVYCGFWKGESGLDPKVFWTGGGSGLEAFRALLLCARPPPPFSFASHFLLKPKKRMIHVSCNGNRNDNNLNADEGDNEHEFESKYDDDGDDDLASKELSVELELLSESDPPPTSLVFPWHCAVDYCFQLLFLLLLLLLLFPWHCAFDYWWTRLDWWKQQRQYFWTFWNVVCFSLKCWGAEGLLSRWDNKNDGKYTNNE